MKGALKGLAERALVSSGAARLTRHRFRDRSIVLAYHNIVPHGHEARGDSSLHLAQHEFARQLDALAVSHAVVNLDEVLGARERSDRPRVAITFDDAYAGALTAGVDEIVKRGMSATIFVAPSLLGLTTWWDKLADAESGSVEPKLRANVIDKFGGRTDAILKWAMSQPVRVQSDDELPRIATQDKLAAAARKPGITIASHTWSHPDLTSLSKENLDAELTRPLTWLNANGLSASYWLSYPYGLYNSVVEKSAKQAGYRGAFRIDGGWVSRSGSPQFAIPRLNIPAGLSIDGFRIRLAGIGAGR